MDKSFTDFLMAQSPLARPFYLSELATAMTTIAPPTPHIHPALLHWAKVLRQQRDFAHHHFPPLPQHLPLALTTNQSPPFPAPTHSPRKGKPSAFSPVLSPTSPAEPYFYPQRAEAEEPMPPALHPHDLSLQLKLRQLLHSPAYAVFTDAHQHTPQAGKSAPSSPRFTRTAATPPLPDVDGLLDLSIKSTNTTPRKSPLQLTLSPNDVPSPTGRKRTLNDALAQQTNKATPTTTQRNHKLNTEGPMGDVTKKPLTKSPKKTKAVRRLHFDEDKSSPVSGTIIRDIKEALLDAHAKEEQNKYEVTALGIQVTRRGDIDPIYNTVEVTEESRAEISRIENKIGAYVCRLCADEFEDAFGLARHRCACIVHVEYRCPECEKVFSCPANLASHRRWHRPRNGGIPTPKADGAAKRSPLKHKNKTCAETTTDIERLPRTRREWDLTSPHSETSLASTFHPSPEDSNNNEPLDISTSSFFPPDSRLSECVICRKSFPHPHILQAHLATHLSPLRPSPLSLLSAGPLRPTHALSPNQLSPLSSSSYSSSSSTREQALFDLPTTPFRTSPAHDLPQQPTNDDPFPCPYQCQAAFPDLTALASHLTLCHDARHGTVGGLLQTVSQHTPAPTNTHMHGQC